MESALVCECVDNVDDDDDDDYSAGGGGGDNDAL